MVLLRYHDLKKTSTWTECSYDDSAKESMVDSDKQVINFDRVKTAYLNNLGKSEECAASVDALGEDQNGNVYFIEFKNGTIDDRNIRKKVAESLLIYQDITHKPLSYTRQNAEFILVYNPDSIHLKTYQLREIFLARLGKQPCTLYGLDRYYGTWFKKAYMMTAKEFTDKMVNIIGV